MYAIRKRAKPISIFLAIFMLVLSVPYQSGLAGIIETETIIDMARGQEARNNLNSILAREDVQSALVAQGIDPLEAKARIDSLSDAEVIRICDKLDQLPAGGGTLETILIIAFLTFVILLITDIMGYTDIFPFVRSK